MPHGTNTRFFGGITRPSLLGLLGGITPFWGGITHLITPFEGFIEYLEFNTAKTDEFDEVLDNIAFMYSILMIIFHRNSGWLFFQKSLSVVSSRNLWNRIPKHKLCHRLYLYSLLSFTLYFFVHWKISKSGIPWELRAQRNNQYPFKIFHNVEFRYWIEFLKILSFE